MFLVYIYIYLHFSVMQPFFVSSVIVFNPDLFRLTPTCSDQNSLGLQARIYMKFQLISHMRAIAHDKSA